MCCGTADLRGYRTRNSVQELGGREGSRSRTRPTRTSTAAGTARASGELTVRRIWREGTATGAQVRAREGCESRACSTNACRERRDEVRVGGQARRGERTSASTRATRKSLQRPAARQQRRADRDDESSLASESESRRRRSVRRAPVFHIYALGCTARWEMTRQSHTIQGYAMGLQLYPVAVYRGFTKSPSSARLFRRGSTAAHTLTLRGASEGALAYLCHAYR